MKKIPNPTNIFGIRYKIVFANFINFLLDEELKEQNKNCIGEIDLNKCIITLRKKGLSKSKLEQTWLHEVGHGVANELGISIKETDLDRFMNGLYHVLTDNKVDFSIKQDD